MKETLLQLLNRVALRHANNHLVGYVQRLETVAKASKPVAELVSGEEAEELKAALANLPELSEAECQSLD